MSLAPLDKIKVVEFWTTFSRTIFWKIQSFSKKVSSKFLPDPLAELQNQGNGSIP